MNLSKYIGKTFRHPVHGRFVCKGVSVFAVDNQLRLTTDGNVWLLASSCKRVRIVKRKKSQDKLAEIIEYASQHTSVMWAATILGIALDCDFRDVDSALEKYRGSNGKV